MLRKEKPLVFNPSAEIFGTSFSAPLPVPLNYKVIGEIG